MGRAVITLTDADDGTVDVTTDFTKDNDGTLAGTDNNSTAHRLAVHMMYAAQNITNDDDDVEIVEVD